MTEPAAASAGTDVLDALRTAAAPFTSYAEVEVLDATQPLWVYRLIATVRSPPVWFSDREARVALTTAANDLIDALDAGGWQFLNTPAVTISGHIDFTAGGTNPRTWRALATFDVFAP